MNLSLHVFAKDLRRYWILGAFAAVFITIETLAPFWGWHFEFGKFELGKFLVAFAKWPIVFILIVAVMQEDLTVGDRAFWRTRPFGAGAVLAGKLLFFAVAIALPTVLANIRIASAFDAPGPVALGMAVETTGFTLLAILTAALLAAMTGNLLHACLAGLGGAVVVAIIGAVREVLVPFIRIRLPWDTDVAYPGPRVAFACALACIALGILLVHQFYTRRTYRTLALLAGSVPVVLSLAVTWTVDDVALSIPAARAAAFLKKPIASAGNLGLALATPARIYGNTWTYDPGTRHYRPGFAVAVYADLHDVPPGRFFELVDVRSALQLRDGREFTFSASPQWNSFEWNNAQRRGAISRALGFAVPNEMDEPNAQGIVRLFNLSRSQLTDLGGKQGRLSSTLTLGETVFRTEFRLPVRAGSIYRDAGQIWRLGKITTTDENVVDLGVQYLRATTMLAPRSEARADFDFFPTAGRYFVLVNRKRAEYAEGSLQVEAGQPGIVTSYIGKIHFDPIRRSQGRAPGVRFDDAWLAEAELVILHTDPVGKAEKVAVLEDFEVPRQ